MGPGFESQPNHSDQSAFRREALFSFMADSELAQVRTGMKKEQVSASAEARFDPLHVGDVGSLLPADSELAQVRTGMKKEQVSASAEARFDPLHVGDVGYLLHQSTITLVAENTEGDQDD
jgi:hypothetical protein